MTPPALARSDAAADAVDTVDAVVDDLLTRSREEGQLTLVQLRHVLEESGIPAAAGRTVLRRLAEGGVTLSVEAQNVLTEADLTAEEEDETPDVSLDEEAPTTDLVRLYLTDIGKVALLNAEQEVELSKRIEAGLYAEELLRRAEAGEMPKHKASYARELRALVVDGHRAKQHLLEANLRLVVSLAKRYQGKGLTLLDLVQEGNIGLVRAVEKFDYAKGYKFSTYATWWIRQALQRAIADQSRTIRVPVHMVEQINKAVRMRRLLDQQLGRTPTSEELAEALGTTPDKVEEVLSYGQDTISLESPVGDTGDTSLGDLIEDAETFQASTAVEFRDLQRRLSDVLATLPERSATVMALRYGLFDGRARTLAEVGEELGLTRERVRQIERDTIKHLRKSGTAEPLRTFLD